MLMFVFERVGYHVDAVHTNNFTVPEITLKLKEEGRGSWGESQEQPDIPAFCQDVGGSAEPSLDGNLKHKHVFPSGKQSEFRV